MIRDLNSYRILVIEDNPGDYAIVEDFISEHILDLHLTRAVNFKEALTILTQQKGGFDIVLLDVSLPDKAGKALITEILSFSGHAPVIVLTGYTDIEFSIQSVSLGVSDYLLKDDLNSIALYKSMLHAIERKKIIVYLEESEKRYSDLFHLSPLPVLVCEQRSLRILDMNKAAIEYYGYTEEELLLMSLHEIEADKENPIAGDALPSMADTTHTLSYKRHRKKNGDISKVDIRINPVQFKGQEANLLLMNDITERVKYIKAIEKQNKQLREIAWVQSHVVRAPLARMMGIVNVLTQTAVSEDEQKKLLHSFIESGAEMDAIIKEITCKTKSIHIGE